MRKNIWGTVLHSKKGGFFQIIAKEEDIDVQAYKISKIEGVVCRVIRGERCKTRAELFHEFAAALNFPTYFGNNWDAFHELIIDLYWLPARRYVIIITRLDELLFEEQKELNTLFIILKDAIVEWNRKNEFRPSTPFNIIFQCTIENGAECKHILKEQHITPEY